MLHIKMGVHYGICVNVKLNLAILCMDQCGKCVSCVLYKLDKNM